MRKNSKEVLKFVQYIKENSIDTPENYISSAFKKLANRLENLFVYYQVEEDGKIMKYGEKRDLDKKRSEISFAELGLEKNDIEISKKSLKLQFSDAEYLYDFLFYIELEDAMPKDTKKDFDFGQIENCKIKMKKFTNDTFELVAGPLTRTMMDNKKINLKELLDEKEKGENKLEKLLVDLKIELDEISGEEEQFEIETE